MLVSGVEAQGKGASTTKSISTVCNPMKCYISPCKMMFVLPNAKDGDGYATRRTGDGERTKALNGTFSPSSSEVLPARGCRKPTRLSTSNKRTKKRARRMHNEGKVRRNPVPIGHMVDFEVVRTDVEKDRRRNSVERDENHCTGRLMREFSAGTSDGATCDLTRQPGGKAAGATQQSAATAHARYPRDCLVCPPDRSNFTSPLQSMHTSAKQPIGQA